MGGVAASGRLGALGPAGASRLGGLARRLFAAVAWALALGAPAQLVTG